MTHEVSPWGFTCRFSIRRRDELLICFEYPRQDRLLSVIDSTYDNLDFALAHLLADVGDYKLFSREQHLASFIKMWCPQSTAQPRALQPTGPKSGPAAELRRMDQPYELIGRPPHVTAVREDFERFLSETGTRGIGRIELPFGFAWANDIYPGEWEPRWLSAAEIRRAVSEAETRKLGAIGSDDLFLTIPELATQRQ